jgi:hypothetical protein
MASPETGNAVVHVVLCISLKNTYLLLYRPLSLLCPMSNLPGWNNRRPVGNPDYRSLSAVASCPLIAFLPTLNRRRRLAVSVIFLLCIPDIGSYHEILESLANWMASSQKLILPPQMLSETFDRRPLEEAFRGSQSDSFVFSSHHLSRKCDFILHNFVSKIS